jgi:hypothetical protein
MNKKYLILIMFSFLCSRAILPQKSGTPRAIIKIMHTKIDLVEKVRAFKPDFTHVYPSSKVAFWQNHYKFNFSIKLFGDTRYINGQFKFKCIFANGKVTTFYTNPRVMVLYPDQNYGFEYDIKTEDNFFGKAEIQLIKYYTSTRPGKPDVEVICDKAYSFIQ